MKKVFTLLTLAMLAMTSAWADDLTVTWSMADGASSTGVANPTANAKNIEWSMGSNIIIDATPTGTYFEKTFTRFTNKTKLDNNRSKINDNYIEFKFTPNGGSFKPTDVTFDITKIGTGDPNIWVYVIDGDNNTITLGENVTIRKSSEDTPSETQTFTVSGAASSENAVALRIYIGKLATNKQVGLANVVISGTYVSADAPVLTASPDAITLAVNPITRAKDATFKLAGKNLTNGTYDLNIPAVDGLSVSPTSFTVSGGTCDQEFTVSYTSTDDVAEAVANITATIGNVTSVEATATVAVTYSSVAALYTQVPTGYTTWDWSKYGVKEIKTEGTEFYRSDILVANVAFYGYGAPAAAFGPADALVLSGDYIVRDSKYCQVTSVKFTTSVAGLLKVVFSNTGGGDRPYRYLYVNGKDTGVGSNSGTMVTADNIYIPAGDVELTAIIDPASSGDDAGNSSFMRVSLIEFKALPENTSITIDNGTGYRTFASKYPTDWSAVTGVSAYTAKIEGTTVSFNKVTGAVPAGEGLLLKADETTATTVTVPIPTETPAAIENAFIGVTKATVVGPGSFVLYNGADGIGFYKTTAAEFTVGANTAYLPAAASSARFIAIDGETTGISELNAQEQPANGNIFSISGQRVEKAQKGLYIVNGKKVMVK